MDHKEILRAAMKESDTTQKALAELMGYAGGQSVIGTMLGRKDIYTDTFVKLLDKMGYEVVVQKKGSVEHPGDLMVLSQRMEE